MSGEGKCDEDKDGRDWVTDNDWVMSGDGGVMKIKMVVTG
jgi:hypothetical protein